MTKDQFQVGDLVIWSRVATGVGLVIEGLRHWQYRVYWFKTGRTTRHSRKYLIKLEIPNE